MVVEMVKEVPQMVPQPRPVEEEEQVVRER
jgi:hypothetical protein